MPETHDRLLRALKRERLHVERHALAESPPAVQRRFAHAWAPVDLLGERLVPWPGGLLAFWLAAPAGHIVLTAGPSTYVPGPVPLRAQAWHDRELQAVARISLADLLDDPRATLGILAHLVDHLLGSQGAAGAPWLSDGAGATPPLQAVGERFAALARLGYGPTEPHAYFAWAFGGYWLDRRALNVADPNVERLLRTTLADEAFWAGHHD
jgi:hypothetical protein